MIMTNCSVKTKSQHCTNNMGRCFQISKDRNIYKKNVTNLLFVVMTIYSCKIGNVGALFFPFKPYMSILLTIQENTFQASQY